MSENMPIVYLWFRGHHTMSLWRHRTIAAVTWWRACPPWRRHACAVVRLSYQHRRRLHSTHVCVPASCGRQHSGPCTAILHHAVQSRPCSASTCSSALCRWCLNKKMMSTNSRIIYWKCMGSFLDHRIGLQSFFGIMSARVFWKSLYTFAKVFFLSTVPKDWLFCV